jgi:transcription termination/antitermination protein NusG
MSEMGDITSWFVAYVKYCHEKRVASLLEALGVEYYLPIQQIRRKWSDRVKIADRLVLPRLIFVRTTLNRRIYLLNEIPSMLGYMTICGAYTPVVVPDHQLELFRFMVENADENVYIETGPLSPGDHVRVKEGPLEGLECDLVEVEDRRCIAVGLGVIGNATLEISPSKLEKVKVT